MVQSFRKQRSTGDFQQKPRLCNGRGEWNVGTEFRERKDIRSAFTKEDTEFACCHKGHNTRRSI